MTTKQVNIRRDSELENATITYGPGDRHYHLELGLRDGRTLLADDGDYFECLVTVRRVLEQEGALVCCQGARPDVWPSGMARDMGAGLKAYVLVNGKVPTLDDLVDVFEPAEPTAVGTVAEQEKRRDAWFAARAASPTPKTRKRWPFLPRRG